MIKMKELFIKIFVIMCLGLLSLPIVFGVIYLEYYQGERAFVRCLETVNDAILVIDYKSTPEAFYFAYVQKPEAVSNNATWRDLANCQDKYIDGTSLYLVAVVIVPEVTIEGRLTFLGYVVMEGILTDARLLEAEDINSDDFKIYNLYDVPFQIIGNGYHLAQELMLMRNYGNTR